MRFRHCPRCRRHSLFQNGAFWVCGACRYAVTQTALLIDEARTKADPVVTFDVPS